MVRKPNRRFLGLTLGLFPYTSLTTLRNGPHLSQDARRFLVPRCPTQLRRTRLSACNGQKSGRPKVTRIWATYLSIQHHRPGGDMRLTRPLFNLFRSKRWRSKATASFCRCFLLQRLPRLHREAEKWPQGGDGIPVLMMTSKVAPPHFALSDKKE